MRSGLTSPAGAVITDAPTTGLPTRLLTPSEVAERLAVSRSMVYALLKRSDGLAATWIGRLPRIAERDLAEYLQRLRRA